MVVDQWANQQVPLAGDDFAYSAVDKNGKSLRPIPYQELDLNASWESFDLRQELTDKGIGRFVDDYQSTLAPAA